MPKFYLTLFLLLLTCLATAQRNDELIEALDAAEDPREQYGILYQLTKNYNSTTRQSDIDRAINFGERAYKAASRTGDAKLTGAAAFLLGQVYLRKRDYTKADSRFKTAADIGRRIDNPDLVLRAVNERSKMATRKANYRRAATIYEEALDFFSENDEDLETLQAKLEQERANLRRQRQQVESETRELAAELARLQGEQGALRQQNHTLQQRNVSSNQQLAARQRELVETAEQKAAAEEKVRESRAQIKDLNDEALEQAALAALAREQLAEEALSRKEAELLAMQAEANGQKTTAQRNYAMGIGGGLFLIAALFYSRFRNKAKTSRKLAAANEMISEARKRSDDLLENILPADIARELKETGEAKARRFPEATVLFCDFVNFTGTAETLGPEALVRELDICFKGFDNIIDRYEGVEKIKTIGDAYMVASGLSTRKSMPTDLIRAALEMQRFLEVERQKRNHRGLPAFTARIGVHTGPVVAGVVGARKFAYDIWGDTVNVASRMETRSEAGRVNVSETTFHLIKYSFTCSYRGKVEVKNKGMVDMYFVEEEKLTA